ncbi:phage tail protein [Vibrio cyclitrophicus]
MVNVSDKSILTAAGKALLAQLNAEEKALVIDKMIFANVPNRPEYPQPDDVVPTDNVVHQAAVEQRGRLSEDSVIYSTTLASNEGPFEFNWTGAYCSEFGVLVTIDHHSLTPKTVDEPGVSGNTLVRSVVLEYKDIAEITNITVDASTWQYNATPRMKKMDNDVAQANIDQNGKDWFIEEGFLVTPQASAFSIKAGAGYVSGNRVALGFDRSIQAPNKPSFIYIDAHREGTPTGEQVTLFNFVVSAEEKDDYIDSSTGKDVQHFVCKIAQVLGDGSVSDLRPESSHRKQNQSLTGLKIQYNVEKGTVIAEDTDAIQLKNHGDTLYPLAGKFDGTEPVTSFTFEGIRTISTASKTVVMQNIKYWNKNYANLRAFWATGKKEDDATESGDLAAAYTNQIEVPPGIFKCNITMRGGGFKLKGSGTLSHKDKTKKIVTVSNPTWNFGVIEDVTIDGFDGIGDGVGYDHEGSGRVIYRNPTIINCDIAIHKDGGNIGNIYDGVHLKYNNFAFRAASHQNMHCGNDTWIGGDVSENGYGIVYLNSKAGGGSVKFTGTVCQYNEVNALLYTSTTGYAGFFDLENLWNEHAYLRPDNIPELIEPSMANQPYFDSKGQWVGNNNSITIYGDATADGFGLEGNFPEILSPMTIKNAAIFDITTRKTNMDVLIESASFDSGMLYGFPPMRVNRLKSIKTGTINRGAFVALPEGQKFTRSDNLVGSFGLPPSTQLSYTYVEEDFNAVIPNTSFISSRPFASSLLKLIPSVTAKDAIVHGVTITRKFDNATEDDWIGLYYFVNDSFSDGENSDVRIHLSSLPLNVPTTFMYCAGANAGDTVGIHYRRNGQEGDVQIQDMFQYSVDESELLHHMNNRVCPSNNGKIFLNCKQSVERIYPLSRSSGGEIEISGLQGTTNPNSKVVMIAGNNSDGSSVSELFLLDLRVKNGRKMTAATRVGGGLVSGVTFSYKDDDILVIKSGTDTSLKLNAVITGSI